ncbi:sensor histidine kinase [Limosilactobacillus gorillae]|jgi:signal transduction histidine kinase|uniref:sensor histidine kinase n=1 Tax=Limosilactobacillus gorillae TaxID=1450649 RepID=UPI000A4E9775|nr:HAMP domain-containing sensor histidine kinase [Limosilactobacillus gorillae]
MRLMYRQMLGFVAVILSLMVILTISFISVTDQTTYQSTWRQLTKYSDSLVWDSIRYNPKTNDFAGFENSALSSNARLLSRQDVHFAIYNAAKKELYASNGFTPKLTSDDWEHLRKGDIVKKKADYPSFRHVDVEGRESLRTSSEMTLIIHPYFYKQKLVAIVTIGTFVSSMRQNIKQLIKNFVFAFLLALLVALIISYMIARSLTKRIDKLNTATHQVAQGNYQVHLANKNKDELDELSANFNQMVSSLRESQEEIRRQEERRKQFMADAAHEMRTPLTTINGLLEGLAYDAIPEEDKMHSIQLMQNDTKRLIRLVNDNLNYEKIRTNQISMERKVFDGAAVLVNLKEQLHKKAAANNDELELTVPNSIPVYADYDRFVQIMFNIVQNAIQFTTNGKINISARRVTHGTEVKIADTGIGMTKEQVKNIWERFYKADRSRMNSQYGESGLGMAIVHQLVELHGGKINVDSVYGKGTTFTIFFPDREHAPHSGDEHN